MNRKHLTRPAAIAAIVLLVAGSLAYAAWSVNGSGTGAASATSSLNLTLTPGSPSTALFPGANGDVATSIANPNPFPVHVTSIAIDFTPSRSNRSNTRTAVIAALSDPRTARVSASAVRPAGTVKAKSRWHCTASAQIRNSRNVPAKPITQSADR